MSDVREMNCRERRFWGAAVLTSSLIVGIGALALLVFLLDYHVILAGIASGAIAMIWVLTGGVRLIATPLYWAMKRVLT